MRRQAPRNLHCAIESLAADRFVHQPFPFGFTRIQWLTHEDVHECSWCSDGARQPLRAAGTGQETKVCLRQPDQVVAILGNTKMLEKGTLTPSPSPLGFGVNPSVETILQLADLEHAEAVVLNSRTFPDV